MRKFALPLIAFIAVLGLAGCSGADTKTDELNAIAPAAPAPEKTASETPAVPSTISTPVTRIDAAAFLNALVNSGCDIDKAEYKEVIRGGGIVVVCTKRVDVLDTEGLGKL